MTALETALKSTDKPARGRLSVQGVTKVYRNKSQIVEALKSISFDIEPGEFVVLVGPSGCGKSTLLNMIAGFEKPSEGQILEDGVAVTGPAPQRLIMFQEHALFPWLNVLSNVAFGLRWNKGFSRSGQKERARELLHMVHLEQFERANVHQLSGGMKQRVALARALAPDPKILLIDEPFPALDALTRQKLYGDLQEIFTKTRKTIISVSHDTREAACLADRVIVFSGRPGRVLAEVKIDLPRPRDLNDPRVAQYSGQIVEILEGTNSDEKRSHT